jgi:hypothetical protein
MATAEEKWASGSSKLWLRILRYMDYIRRNWKFILYVIFAIIVTITSYVVINNSGRSITAFVTMGLFILTFVLFYQRWFVIQPSKFNYEGEWPPVVNMCPDYLVYFRNGTKDTCIDLLGVNQSGGSLRAWTTDDNPENPPTDPSKYFPFIYKNDMTDSEIEDLKKKTSNIYNLTWEGITDDALVTSRQCMTTGMLEETTKVCKDVKRTKPMTTPAPKWVNAGKKK